MVNNLTVDAFAVALAVAHVDVVVLIDVVRCLIDGVVVAACDVAVDRLVDSAVAHIRIEIAVRGIGCVDVRILVDVGHRSRIDIVIRVHRCAGAGIHVVVVVGVRGCAGRSVVVVIRVRAGRRIGVVRCAGRGRGVNVFRRGNRYSLCQHHRR